MRGSLQAAPQRILPHAGQDRPVLRWNALPLMSQAMSAEEMRAFLLRGTRTAKLASTRPDGRPHVVPVWFVLDGDDVVFTTGAKSVKARNMRHQPLVSICVDDESPPFAFVQMEGEASLSEDLDAMRKFGNRSRVIS